MAAVPDLGVAQGNQNLGNNSIHDVINANGKLAGGPRRLGGFPIVKAEKNWWGTVSPPAQRFSSWVDYSPTLSSNPITTPPASAQIDIGPLDSGRWFVRPPYPMPFSDKVTIPFKVGSAHELVVIKVFDLRGTLVRTLMSTELNPGQYSATWDGSEEDGRRTSEGIYFAQVKIGQQERTLKVVLLK